MDILYLRSEFLSIKNILQELTKNNPRRNGALLQKANESELNILIKILHLISIGAISIRKEDFKVLKNSKRLNLLKTKFESQEKFLKTLKLDNQEKKKLLKKFCALYANLLYTMFHKV